MPSSEGRRPSRPAAEIKASEQNENTGKIVKDIINKIFHPRGGLNIIQKLIGNNVKYSNIEKTYKNITDRVDTSIIPNGDKIKLLILRSIVENTFRVANLDTNRKELEAILQGIQQDIRGYKNPTIEEMIDKKVFKAFNKNKEELAFVLNRSKLAFVLNRSSEKSSSESGPVLTLVTPKEYGNQEPRHYYEKKDAKRPVNPTGSNPNVLPYLSSNWRGPTKTLKFGENYNPSDVSIEDKDPYISSRTLHSESQARRKPNIHKSRRRNKKGGKKTRKTRK